MSALTVVVAAFVLALMVSSLLFGVGIIGVPVALLAVALIATLDFAKRRKQAASLSAHRERASTDKVNFSERDKQTLVSE
jgi:mannose/fructose/N-acetylgalactosamine-specific phosphotransferase system component IIC